MLWHPSIDHSTEIAKRDELFLTSTQKKRKKKDENICGASPHFWKCSQFNQIIHICSLGIIQ